MNLNVSLVVRVLDDYTGKWMGDHLEVSVAGERPPVVKENGYFVFTGLKRNYFSLRISHPFYQEMVIPVDLCASELIPELTVRLKPGIRYPGLDKITAVMGFTAPETELRLWCVMSGVPFKLWKDYKEGNFISIFYPHPVNLAGIHFCINNTMEERREFFRVVRAEYGTKWKYRMEQPLSSGYSKAETGVYPVYEAKADKRGGFLICLWEKIPSGARCFLSTAEKPYETTEIVLQPGTLNRVNLEKE